MNIKDSIKLMELYAACPKCGCEVLGNGKGTLECDTAVGYFRRTCACGWYVEVKEGLLDEPVTNLRPELPLEEEDEDEVSEPEGLPTLEEEPVPVPEPVPEPTHTHTHRSLR